VERDWLIPLLSTCAERFDRAAAEARLAAFRAAQPELTPKLFLRRYIEHRLRELGVVYGTPRLDESGLPGETLRGLSHRQAVFLALQQVQADLALEVGCAVGHCSRGTVRVAELLLCSALFCRRRRLAERIHRRLLALDPQAELPPRLRRWGRKLSKLVVRRAYLAGNPLLGLPMHNSCAYGDAKTYCRVALAYFEHGRPQPAALQAVWDYHDRERRMLLQALVGLTLADRPIGVGSRRVMMAQIRSARLPRTARRELLAALGRPVSTLAVAAAVDDARSRDFLIEQVLLGAMLDGHLSEREWGYIEELAAWLDVSPQELAAVEARVIGFYEQHRDYLDLFTVGTAVRDYRQRMLDRLQRGIAENLGLIVDEIRAKGDLAELLVRASHGERLEREQWRQVRRQLLDIVRSIPSLAIFSLPGGAVLLPLVFKLLPAGLKPRAFAERPPAADDGGDPLA
jgi:uncharacterized membrane protein YebE (DUF533 family)